MWQFLQEMPEFHRLRLPIRRWEFSLFRSNQEDRLIDAWIGLEALCESNRGHLERQIARVLGSGEDDSNVRNQAKIIYRWRDTIVHSLGRENISARQPLRDAALVAREYLRQALLESMALAN
jgi:hypothetical protein